MSLCQHVCASDCHYQAACTTCDRIANLAASIESTAHHKLPHTWAEMRAPWQAVCELQGLACCCRAAGATSWQSLPPQHGEHSTNNWLHTMLSAGTYIVRGERQGLLKELCRRNQMNCDVPSQYLLVVVLVERSFGWAGAQQLASMPYFETVGSRLNKGLQSRKQYDVSVKHSQVAVVLCTIRC